jgi:tRNA(Ser,Leu) C12 N-acetylase TAN1
MRNWNVVVTTHDQGYRQAQRALRKIGSVYRTALHNVLVMHVDDPRTFLDDVDALARRMPDFAEVFSHVHAFERCFDFTTTADFERCSREVAKDWAPRLAGKTFHVRMHRRGPRNGWSGVTEAGLIADEVLGALRAGGASAQVRFDDPDAVILVETVDGRAGMTIVTRDERHGRPYLAAL